LSGEAVLIRCTFFSVIAVLCLAITTFCEVPQLINYQGRLTDAGNNPVPDGSYDLIFSLYDVETGGSPFWAETLSTVAVQNGLFGVILGATTPFGGSSSPSTALAAAQKQQPDAPPAFWLGIKLGAEPEFPRSQLLSVPFAFDADRADTANYAYNARSAGLADSAWYANSARWADSAGYASGALWSDSSGFAFSSMWSDSASHAISVADSSVFSSSIHDGTILLQHLDQNGAADGQIIRWSDAQNGWELVDESIGVGDITAVLAGNGLAGGGTSGEVVLGIPTGGITSFHIVDGDVRAEDLDSFGATDGQMLRWNGSLSTWEPIDEVGDISSVAAGSGMTGGGASGDVVLSIASNGVNSTHIQNGTITEIDIANNAITSAKIATQAVTGADIATSAVTNAHIQDGTIISQDIADGQVMAADIGAGQVIAGKLGSGAVIASNIAPSSIHSGHLQTNSVASDELVSNSVTAVKIASSAVESSKIADNAVTGTKIASNAINSSKVENNSLLAHDIGDEPGIGSGKQGAFFYLPDTSAVIVSQSITVPQAGYIFVSGNSQVEIDNAPLQTSDALVTIWLDSTAYGGWKRFYWKKDGEIQASVPTQYVFQVSAGTHLVELRGKNALSGTVGISHTDIAVMYFPTAYGSVAPPSTSQIESIEEVER
jgi:hypothetical protein